MFSTFSWWHAIAIFIIANAISALPAGLGGDFNIYNSFRKPRVSPPDWAFAPIWLFLNVTSLIALYIIASGEQAEETYARIFFWCEAVGWVTFAIFTMLYFQLRSPVFGAIDTVIGLVAAILSFWFALKINYLAAGLIGLRVFWLCVASYVSVYVALNNRDLFLSR